MPVYSQTPGHILQRRYNLPISATRDWSGSGMAWQSEDYRADLVVNPLRVWRDPQSTNIIEREWPNMQCMVGNTYRSTTRAIINPGTPLAQLHRAPCTVLTWPRRNQHWLECDNELTWYLCWYDDKLCIPQWQWSVVCSLKVQLVDVREMYRNRGLKYGNTQVHSANIESETI